MAQAKKTGAASKAAPFKNEPKFSNESKFNVDKLTLEQQEAVVAKYIGIHPKYFWYKGRSIDVDQYKLSKDGIEWTGFESSRNYGK